MRKQLLVLVASCGLITGLTAQDSETTFNKWSVDLGAGVNKPLRPVAAGFTTSTPSFITADLGLRYMFNNKFGLKGDLGYSEFSENDNSRDFRSIYVRGSIQGIANLRSILNLQDISPRIGLLAHAGGGISTLSPEEPNDKPREYMVNFIAGLTPQIKLSNRVALFGDISGILHARQDYTFDGSRTANTRGIDGFFMTGTVGINVYLGANEEHADWIITDLVEQNELDALENRVAGLEGKMVDTDGDGVPDYLDADNNTVAGAAVDSRGNALDKNNNGIPDELESSLDNRYAAKGDVTNQGSNYISTGSDVIEKLINGGYVNVYFKFGSSQPEVYSYEAINYLAQYMRENPTVSADLVGYADEIGGTNANQRLSERRAKKVYDILVASGISGSRLTATGAGEDTSVDRSSEPARQLVRRVTFKLKK